MRILPAFLTPLVIAFLSALACSRRERLPPPPPPSAAVVDGAPIPLSALQRELDRLRRAPGKGAAEAATGQPNVEGKDLPALGRALLEPLIERKILLERAQAAGLTVSEAEVQRATDALAEAARAGGQSFQERLAQDGQTAESLAEETRERLLAEKYVAEQVRNEKPSPAELRAWFDAHRAEFERPEEVRALQILVDSPDEAKSLLDQLRKGASFEELAKGHGRSPDAKQGGDLGWFARGRMPKEFDETCFALKVGQISGVVRTSYGYHLFKLAGRRGARKRSYEEVKAEVVRRTTAEKRALAERQLLEQVRKAAQVQVNEPALALLR